MKAWEVEYKYLMSTSPGVGYSRCFGPFLETPSLKCITVQRPSSQKDKMRFCLCGFMGNRLYKSQLQKPSTYLKQRVML